MQSNLSDGFKTLKLNDDQIRLNPNQRRSVAGTGVNHRLSVQSKRSATIDGESHDERLRIVVLGATKVGKTCLCQQFLQQKFLIDHKETLDEMHSVEICVSDRRLVLEILDTAGIDEFPVMRRLAIARGDAFLIVYAIDDPPSLVIAEQMRKLVLEIKEDFQQSSSPPILLVANKSDLRSQLDRDKTIELLQNQSSIDSIETSCHQRETVHKAFHQLLQMANVQLSLSNDVSRRSSDPNLSKNKESRGSSKRQSCAQQ